MATLGSFDAELRSDAWLDTANLVLGWYEYALPFDHSLIDAAASATDTFPAYFANWTVFEEQVEEITCSY